MSTIKFNAGKVQYDEATRRCTPWPNRGTITIQINTDENNFRDFIWAPKTACQLEEDELLIIPGDVSFKHITTCKTGRVFCLTFLSSGAKYLYWLQDPGDEEDLGKLTDKDANLLKQIQDILVTGEDHDPETDGQSEGNQ